MACDELGRGGAAGVASRRVEVWTVTGTESTRSRTEVTWNSRHVRIVPGASAGPELHDITTVVRFQRRIGASEESAASPFGCAQPGLRYGVAALTRGPTDPAEACGENKMAEPVTAARTLILMRHAAAGSAPRDH